MNKSLYLFLGLIIFVSIASCNKKKDEVVKSEVLKPLCDFAITPSDEDPFTFKFMNSSANYISSDWQFGDDSTSAETSPVHTFLHTGVFDVMLTVVNKDGYWAKEELRVHIYVDSIINFYAMNTGVNNIVKFVSTLKVPTGSSIVWDFGDGSPTSTDESPTKKYDKVATLYSAKLTLTTSKGSVAKKVKKVISSEGTVIDVTDTHLENAGRDSIPHFSYTVRDATSYGTIADWTVNDAVKNKGMRRDMGGYTDTDGGTMTIETWYGEPLISNGKIYQTDTLAAGSYMLQVEFIGFYYNGSPTGFVTVAEGPTLPDISNIGTALGTSLFNVPTVEVFFTLAKPTEVSMGILAEFVTGLQYFRARQFRLYLVDHQ